ncbi:unnamed protein product, partial [Brenthis ino]
MDGMSNNDPRNGYILENNVLKRIVQDPAFGQRHCTVVSEGVQEKLHMINFVGHLKPGDQMTVSAEEDDSPASTNEAIASTSRSNIVEQRTQEYQAQKENISLFQMNFENSPIKVIHAAGAERAPPVRNGRIGATSFI